MSTYKCYLLICINSLKHEKWKVIDALDFYYQLWSGRLIQLDVFICLFFCFSQMTMVLFRVWHIGVFLLITISVCHHRYMGRYLSLYKYCISEFDSRFLATDPNPNPAQKALNPDLDSHITAWHIRNMLCNSSEDLFRSSEKYFMVNPAK